MMTEKRYEVESKMSQLAEDVADEHDLDYDFYGDCYPAEIMDLENKMEFADKEDWEELLAEAKEIFEGCVPADTDYKGQRWGELTEEQQEKLLKMAFVDDDNIDKRTGECIIDFESLSVSGKVNLESDSVEYTIDDDAMLYNSNEGINY